MPDDGPQFTGEYDPADAVEPRQKRRKLSPEWKLQAQCFKLWRARCRVNRRLQESTRLFASMNEGQRTPQRAAIAKMMGMVPGMAWDLTLLVKHGAADRYYLGEMIGNGLFEIYWIEIKREDGKLSAAQKDIAQWLAPTPIKTRVVRTIEEFIEILEGR